VLAEAGFDAKELNPLDTIPPIRRHDTLVDPDRKARADLVATARLDGLFGQRWKTETVNSVIKRKFGRRTLLPYTSDITHFSICITNTGNIFADGIIQFTGIWRKPK
jgi:hypothetical protein